jgi:predicted RNase H-like HicB family nuclease
MSDYHINVLWSPEARCYVADIPDLSYCSAFGGTPQEALAEVLVARELWLATARAQGKPVPSPRYRPVVAETMGRPYTAASPSASSLPSSRSYH